VEQVERRISEVGGVVGGWEIHRGGPGAVERHRFEFPSDDDTGQRRRRESQRNQTQDYGWKSMPHGMDEHWHTSISGSDLYYTLSRPLVLWSRKSPGTPLLRGPGDQDRAARRRAADLGLERDFQPVGTRSEGRVL